MIKCQQVLVDEVESVLNEIIQAHCVKAKLNKEATVEKLNEMKMNIINKIKSQIQIDEGKKKKKIMEPLDRRLIDRVYELDKDFDELVKRVELQRQSVPELALDCLDKQMNILKPSLPEGRNSLEFENHNENKNNSNQITKKSNNDLETRCSNLANQLSELRGLVPKQLESLESTRHALEKTLCMNLTSIDCALSGSSTSIVPQNHGACEVKTGGPQKMRSRLAQNFGKLRSKPY